MTGELIPWLHQQLDAVEAKAKAATRGPWRVNAAEYGATVDGPDALQDGGYDHEAGERRQVMRPLVVIPPDVDYGAVVALEDAEHIAFHDPVRALTEVDAKRRILDAHPVEGPSKYVPFPYCGTCQGGDGIPTGPAPCPTQRALALPFADRPGYQERWRL